MDTESDDPTTLAIVALAGAGAAGGVTAAKAWSKDGGSDSPAPAVAAPPVKQTAAALPQLSEAAVQNRKRKASALTRDFKPPVLGIPGLLGSGL